MSCVKNGGLKNGRVGTNCCVERRVVGYKVSCVREGG